MTDLTTAATPSLAVRQGDAIEALRSGGISALGHQVNLRGVMGAGIAAQIRRQFPAAFEVYRAAIAAGRLRLGDALPVEVAPGRWIVHLAGQQNTGRGLQTDYAALALALSRFTDFAREHQLRPGLPYGIGCGLAGGDWPTVAALIASACPDVALYRL